MRVSARLLTCISCVFALSILIARPTTGQDSKPSADTTGSTTIEAATSAPATAPDQINIFYTSQLFGYFREPDLQPRNSKVEGCAAWANEPYLKQNPEASQSPAARAFRKLWERLESKGNNILVGTGDNLAPVLWARQFDPTSSWQDPEVKGKRTAKELFTWDPDKKKWIRNEDLDEKNENDRKVYGPLLDRLKHGVILGCRHFLRESEENACNAGKGRIRGSGCGSTGPM
jgi:hypothetical protein